MVIRWLTLAAMGYGMFTVAAPAAAAARRIASSDSVEAPRPSRPDPASTQEDIARWIAALSSDVYAERKAATHTLLEAGRATIGPLTLAADSADLEIPGRCIWILKRLAGSSDASTKRAAVDALRKLVRSRHIYVAREATLALLPPSEVPQARVGLVRGLAQVRAVPVQIGGNVRRSLVRELEVEDEGRKVHIRYQTGHQREIRVRITETVDGQKQTQEFKAEDTTELRGRSAQAAELYAKYARELLRQPVQVVADNQRVIQPVARPRPAMQIRVQANQNGERSIQVEQNDRQIQITETNGRDIVVRIAKPANGQRQTVEYRARHLDELKERHPAEAAEVYEKYARGLGIRVGTGRGVPMQTVYGNRGRLEVPRRPAAPKPFEPVVDTPAVPPVP